VKKRQQRVLLILDSKNVQYEVIDIAEPENEGLKDFMQTNCTSPGATISDPNPRHPLPPQIFNDDDYCGVSLFFIIFVFVGSIRNESIKYIIDFCAISFTWVIYSQYKQQLKIDWKKSTFLLVLVICFYCICNVLGVKS
jgi:hypothetical protein